MNGGERTITGEYPVASCTNPLCTRLFSEFERRIEKLERDETKAKLWEVLRRIEQDLANLKGRLVGYQFAGGLLGAIVGALAATVAMIALK